MDDMDLIQDATSAAQDAMIEARRKRAALEASVIPPENRECIDCGAGIPAGRLKVKPLANRCVDCQEEVERPIR